MKLKIFFNIRKKIGIVSCSYEKVISLQWSFYLQSILRKKDYSN